MRRQCLEHLHEADCFYMTIHPELLRISGRRETVDGGTMREFLQKIDIDQQTARDICVPPTATQSAGCFKYKENVLKKTIN